MADITVTKTGQALKVFHMGQNGFRMEVGVGAFNSTDASGELACPFQNVLGVFVTPLGTPAADEQISVDEAGQLATNGYISRPTAGTLTITRTGASKTSGLKFMYMILGY